MKQFNLKVMESMKKDLIKKNLLSITMNVILKKFGMELDRAYVFGDSMNDLSMFQYAKHTIAMGNHAKGLDPFTEYVTAEVEKDGIAQAIRHYGLD